MTSDSELLCRYCKEASEDAFAELVRRHLDLVYSAALRQVNGEASLAEEVAQTVFTDLAHKANSLCHRDTLSGWLYTSAYFAAAKAVRGEVRRRTREQEAQAMADLSHDPSKETQWKELQPILDQAMLQLREADREAILLRFFQNHSWVDVGTKLGLSENAARMRIDRALEKLREHLSRQGVTGTAAVLSLTISTNATQAAPVGLAATVLGATNLVGASMASTAHTIIMTTTQKVVLATVLTCLVGAGIYETRRAFELNDRVRELENHQRPLLAQVLQWKEERDLASRKLAAALHEMELLRRELAGVPKLRGEVTRLQREAQESAQTNAGDGNPMQREMKSWLFRVSQLKQRFEQAPGARVPEFELLTEQDWLNAAKSDLNDEKDFRQAMSSLRGAAENKFAVQLRPALKKYMKEHDNAFPKEMSQLQPYFRSPINEAVLSRYEILPATDIPNLGLGGNWIISQKAAVDEEYDNRIGIGPSGSGSVGPNGWKTNDPLVSAGKLLDPIEQIYKAAHNGMEPTDPSDVLPYLTTPELKAAYETLLKAHKEQEAGEN